MLKESQLRDFVEFTVQEGKLPEGKGLHREEQSLDLQRLPLSLCVHGRNYMKDHREVDTKITGDHTHLASLPNTK